MSADLPRIGGAVLSAQTDVILTVKAAVATAAGYEQIPGNEQTPLVPRGDNNSRKTLLSIGYIPLFVFGCVGLLSLLFLFIVRNSSGQLTFPQFPAFTIDDDAPVKTPTECLGPPYIYVSLHDKISNVLKYSRNGCLIDDAVLVVEEAYKNDDVQFRSLSVGKHKDHDALFIADASTHNSRLLIFGKCIDAKEDPARANKRHFIEVVAERKNNPGLDHSYGVCHDSYGNVYISNQHTDCVLRFAVDTWAPMPLPPALQLGERLDYFTGTFVQFGLPNLHEKDKKGVRAIAHVGAHIWIAHESMSGVVIADVETGHVSDFIQVDTPIGLYHLKELNVTFVSCKSKTRGGIVYAIDINTLQIEYSYVHRNMDHPTGMTSYAGTLFVGEQNNGAIYTFDIVSEKYTGTIVQEDFFRNQIEQIALSPC